MKKFSNFYFLIIIAAFISCENESLGEMKINRDTVDEELIVLIERIATPNEESIECIDFNYSFPLFVFDENMEYLDVILITEDAQFSEFLLNLRENYSISLSYPISGTLSNEDLVEINNNEELA
jgi:hypothetical protein